MAEATLLRQDKDAVAVLRLNRPAVLNALDFALMRQLGEEVRRLQEDEAVRVIVLTGVGDKAFSAGADLKEMRGLSPLAWDVGLDAWQDTFERIERSRKPVIAAVNGYAYGGGTELAMVCHIRVASTAARFAQPEIVHDHIPGAGGSQRLPRLIPLSAAFEHLLTGDPIDSEAAHRLGLVSHVWPPHELLPRTLELAGRIADRAPLAVAYTLEAIREGLKAPLEVGLRLERAFSGLVLESAESKAGLDEFAGKKRKARV